MEAAGRHRDDAAAAAAEEEEREEAGEEERRGEQRRGEQRRGEQRVGGVQTASGGAFLPDERQPRRLSFPAGPGPPETCTGDLRATSMTRQPGSKNRKTPSITGWLHSFSLTTPTHPF